MGFLSKLFGGKKVPDWAAFFTEPEYQAFSELLAGVLAGKSLPTDVKAGNVPVTVGGEKGTIGFDTLARRCKALPQDKWQREISEFVGFALTPTDELIGPFATDFRAASEKLRIQLVPSGFVRSDWEEGLNYVSFGTGIKAALVYDLPTTVTTVPAAHARQWKRSWKEVSKVARDKVREDVGALTPEMVDLGNAPVSQLLGDSYFICSYALWLDTLPDAKSDRGHIVSIPSRHTVLYHPIRDASAWRVLSGLPALSRDLAGRLPGAISPNLFWVRNGQVADIPVNDTGSQLQVMPSKEFCEAMVGLTEP